MPVTPGDAGDEVMQLQVHEGQSLLHMLDVRCRVVQVPFTQPQVGTKCGDVTAWPEAQAQQATGM